MSPASSSSRAAPAMLLAFIGLATGLWAGLLRLGIDLPSPHTGLAGAHGALMVSGFVGTLIGVERAVGFGKTWAFLAPVLTGLGTVGLLIGLPTAIPGFWITLGSLILLAVLLIYQHPSLAGAIMTSGAALWFLGNDLWLGGWNLLWLYPWWAGFLILTIGGERLELAGVLHRAVWVRWAFVLALLPFVAGLLMASVSVVGALAVRSSTPVVYGLEVRLMGLGMIAMAAWLVTFDMARRNLRETGLRRFMGVTLTGGYVWLGAGGLLWLLSTPADAAYGLYYDAMLHAVFLGFVFSMIFAHAPVIFPAVLGRPIAFSPAFYGHVALLNLSLTLRVASDVASWVPGREWGGLLNAVAIVLFFLNMARGARLAKAGRS